MSRLTLRTSFNTNVLVSPTSSRLLPESLSFSKGNVTAGLEGQINISISRMKVKSREESPVSRAKVLKARNLREF